MFMRPGAWKNVVSKVRRPWRMASSLMSSENASAAANILAAGHAIVDQATHERLRAGGHWRHDGTAIVAASAPDPAIGSERQRLIALAEAAADLARDAWLPASPRHLYILAAREAEASALTAGSAATTPFIDAEAGAAPALRKQAAERIVARASEAHAALAAIEAELRRVVAALRAPGTLSGLRAVPAFAVSAKA